MPRQTNRPLTVVALLLGLFLAAMEMTVVSTAMPTAILFRGIQGLDAGAIQPIAMTIVGDLLE